MRPRPNFLAAAAAEPTRHFSLWNDSQGCTVAPVVERAFDSATRRRGLLGRDQLPPEVAFVIAPCNAVHTFGMRFPIDLIFVSRAGEVVKRTRHVPRRRIAAALRAFAVIEFGADHPGVEATRVGDRLRLIPGQLRD